jgi:DHA3 family macrolide efflux protein-like MFS transporter
VQNGRIDRSMALFALIWCGQVVSALGSGLTSFGLGVWLFQRTGSVLQFSGIALAATLPGMLISPFAGALADRWDRRWTIVAGDLASACGTVGILLLASSDRLSPWHVYGLGMVNSLANSFVWPAFNATTPLLVPRQHLVRASGMVQTGLSAMQILAPLLGGVIFVRAGLEKLLLLDLATFAFAVLVLLCVRIPRPERSGGGAGRPSLWSEVGAGWRYVRERPALLSLLLLFAGANFCTSMVHMLFTPLVLSFQPAVVLGRVLSMASLGMLLGGIVVSVWGGPKRRVEGILGTLAVGAFCLFLGSLWESPVSLGAGLFAFLFCLPIAQSCSNAIWQTKVPPDMQGRMFSFRFALATASLPLAFLLAGPLADHVFEPLMAPGGLLAESVGSWIGVGRGRGLALFIALMNVLLLSWITFSWRSKRLRQLEEEVPDALGRTYAPVPAAAQTEGTD